LEAQIALIEALEASYVERARRRKQTRAEEARIAAAKAQADVEAQRAAEEAEAQAEQRKMWYAVSALALVGVTAAIVIKRKRAKK
jgi:hypothetical protein